MARLAHRVGLAAIAALMLAACFASNTHAEGRVAKAIVIGADGVRPDALIVAETPNINRLISNGTFDPRCLILGERYRENDTISGPGWSSIQTGVWADKHGVHDNSFAGRNYEQYPHFFERIKAADPDAKTISIVATWNPIDRYIVSAADVRHFFPLAGAGTVDLNVSAGEVGVNTRDGEWHHLLGMRRGEMIHLYLNGKKVASARDTAGGFDLQGEVYHVGRDARNGSMQFDGELRGVRLWDRALSEPEIGDVAEGRAAGEGDGAALAIDGPLERDRKPIEPPLSNLTQGDFTVAAAFRTTDEGRNILMGNFGDASAGHLNLELHTDNRVRLYVNPPTQADRMEREETTDIAVTDEAVKLLAETDPTAAWVYLHQTDSAGHGFGFSIEQPEYMNAIENFDRHVGRIVDAIESRPTFDEEDWIIVITTDHGGYGTGHSGGHDVPEILHGFLLVSGDAAHNRISPRQTYIVDVVPTVLKHLGIAIDPDLDGNPIGIE
ncbi:MAG: alkaline phosphatase family protein [Phycisphaeraceae bacterium]